MPRDLDRRAFVQLMAAPLVPTGAAIPTYRIVSRYSPAAVPGMPGPWPGKVVAVKADDCVDVQTSAANADRVREMMSRGMCALTGEAAVGDAWRRLFTPSDVVGIKVNAG